MNRTFDDYLPFDSHIQTITYPDTLTRSLLSSSTYKLTKNICLMYLRKAGGTEYKSEFLNSFQQCTAHTDLLQHRFKQSYNSYIPFTIQALGMYDIGTYRIYVLIVLVVSRRSIQLSRAPNVLYFSSRKNTFVSSCGRTPAHREL